MSPGQRGRAHEIYAAARRLERDQRAPYIARACARDDELRAKVEALLAGDRAPDHAPSPDDPGRTADHAGAADPDLTIPGAPVAPARPGDRYDDSPGLPEPPVRTDLSGERLGKFHLKREIASGGMGTVYEAVEDYPRRVVALKVMRAGIASPSALRRFEYEAQILARLRHPGIAQIYEAGVHRGPSGRVPYFAMEYIPAAQSLTHYADSRRLTARQRLELFAKVCDAVHHGHTKGIIHRDLKPGNILVDSSGQPKIIDFGVARATDSDLAITTLQTSVGQIIGTLQYMSPEQCAADPHDLDTRSDVYALGVVLYELLCARLPHEVSRLAIHEAARKIREDPPARPSTIHHHLRGDVETIVLKALEKERDRRYSSAAELAADIRRYLNHEPISARPASVMYQVRMFARRNKTVFRAAVAVAVVLVVGITATSSAIVRAISANERAAELAIAEKAATDARTKATYESYLAKIEAASASLGVGEMERARLRLENCDASLKGWEWDHLLAATQPSIATLEHKPLSGRAAQPRNEIMAASFSADSALIVTASADRTARIWDATTGASLRALEGHQNWVLGAAFNHDGSRLVTASADSTARLWNTRTGSLVADLEGHRAAVTTVICSADGSRILTASADGAARLWDGSTGALVHELSGHPGPVTAIAITNDASRIITGSAEGAALIWDAASGEIVSHLRGHSGNITGAAFSPDGALAVTGGSDGVLHRWDASNGMDLGELAGHDKAITAIVFNPVGGMLATASEDATARLWDPSTGQSLWRLEGHEDTVSALAFRPDGLALATASWDRTARIWDPATGKRLDTLRAHEDGLTAIAYSPDGLRLLTASWDGTAQLWDGITGNDPAVIRGHHQPVVSAEFDATADRVLTASHDHTARIWDARTGSELAVLRGHVKDLNGAAFSPDGGFVVTAAWDDSARVWNASTGDLIDTLGPHQNGATAVAFSHDGALLATGSAAGALYLWRTDTWEVIWSTQAHDPRDGPPDKQHGGAINAIAYSPDGALVATASNDRTARLWEVGTGRAGHVLRAHTDAVLGIAFSHAGKTVVTGAEDRTARRWDRNTGAQIGLPLQHLEPVRAAAFSPDGSRIATACGDKNVHLWEAASGQELAVLRGHTGGVTSVAFSRDGEHLVSGSWDGTARLWHTAPYRDRYPAVAAARQTEIEMLRALGRYISAGDDLQPLYDRVLAEHANDKPRLRAALGVLGRERERRPLKR